MTAQIPDTCFFDGRRWDILEYDGNIEVAPSNEILGINTITESTANWSGRIDHYLVYNRRLFLFKVGLVMPADCKNHIPWRARREIIIRTERMYRIVEGKREYYFADYRITNLIFDDMLVHFNGDLIMEYPHYDLWEYPQSVYQEDDSEYSKRATLSFHSGELVDTSIEDI